MATRGKSNGRGARDRARDALEDSLHQLERQLPKNLSRLVKQLRANLKSLQTQVERLRAERDERWSRLQTQVRRDAAKLFRRLEKAIEPKPARKRSRPRKPAGAARKARKTVERKVETLRSGIARASAPPLAAARRELDALRPIGEPPVN
jgi:DNA repair exonuclease SbcCD ATPase subunit